MVYFLDVVAQVQNTLQGGDGAKAELALTATLMGLMVGVLLRIKPSEN